MVLKRFGRVVALCATAALVGCGDGPLAPDLDSDVSRVELDPAAATIGALGEVVQFTARALDRNGVEIPGVSLAWSSSDSTVLASEGGGRFRARANGSAVVRVRASGNTRVPEQAAEVVVAQRAAALRLPADTLELYAVGHMALIEARVVDALGSDVAGAGLTWLSDDPAIATVDGSGVVTARRDGVVAIAVRAGALAGSVVARVSASLRIAGCLTSADASGGICRSLTLTLGAGR